MSWTENYWDIVNEFYWVPSYLGLKSIPQRHWVVDGDLVSIPKEMTNTSGPLYRRLRSGKDYWHFVRRQEETFNHIFNLALSILPGDIISEIFGQFTGFAASYNYRLCGNSIRDEYPWIGGANVTTPDAFLLSSESALAIEIKFNAKTSLDQLAKYVALIAGEEIYGNRHRNLDLLYICPESASECFFKQTSIHADDLCGEHFELLDRSVKNPRVKEFFAARPSAIVDVLSRLRVACITWSQFLAALKTYIASIGDTPGDRTLYRLLDGLAKEICNHPLSGVEDDVRGTYEPGR